MAARVAILLSLAALVWAGSARAEDDPACAQYHDAMSYNLCLARHGPKANNVGKLRGGPQPARAGQARVWYGQSHGPAQSLRFQSAQGAHRAHGRMHMEFQVR
jgi:hypothetical protein